MFHYKSEHLSRLLTLLDVAITILVYLVVLEVYISFGNGDEGDYENHLGFLVFVVLAFVASRQIIGLTPEFHKAAMPGQIAGILKIMAMTMALVVTALFILNADFVSRIIFVGFVAANSVVLMGSRVFLAWWYFNKNRERPENYLRVLIIGSGRRAHRVARSLSKCTEWGLEVIGFLDPDDPERYNRRKSDRVLGHVSDISRVLKENVVEEIIIAVPRRMLDDVEMIIDACQEEGVRLRYMADFYDFEADRVRLTMVDNIPLLSFEPVAHNVTMLVAKRFMDLVLTLAALPVLAPILLLVAIAIKLDSPGPALFTQPRIGMYKRPFKLYKFRTMVVDAEARIAEIEHLNEADGPNFKIANDPRVTRLGRFLRKSSIDELPQLLNVLKGDMSLVGPRPMSLRDVDLFDKGIQRKRFSVCPGITCLWQVSGRSDLSFDDWLKLDLQYINSWTFWLDIRILLRTIPAVLKGQGAT